MRLEQFLVLNRYFHQLFDARELNELKQPLNVEEGRGPSGQSYFYGALLGRVKDAELRDRLTLYDARIMDYEARLARARGSFTFKYFQYLAALYTEIYLDRLTDDPAGFLSALNAFLQRLQERETSLREVPAFAPDDLRRLAFFMATGSGKTLLLHVNLWQVLHYLERGRYPEALVDRTDGRSEFDSILLITPNEGLTQQHLDEFQRSGIDAALLIADRGGRTLLGPKVKVIEIHKLAEEPSRDGVSVLLDELGGRNLVFVDEGHKGTGSEAQTWKSRQKRLSADGFLLEYSATFAQAIGAAATRARSGLLAEYGKAILFDYSYRHFYGDGYGKDFKVLNLKQGHQEQAHELLVGGLLTYYQQLWLYRQNRESYGPYNLERPLWIFLGSSVNAVFSREGRKQSDVATVVEFFHRFVSEPTWAMEWIGRIVSRRSGFIEADTGKDLFAERTSHLRDRSAEELYEDILLEIFHGRGGLEIWELKNASGELGLRVSAADSADSPYFGVINIGDVAAFKKHLADHLGLAVREDRFSTSLFEQINDARSRINVLVGAKKFIEGWSSWRVSAMGLLNIGKGEGSQVIQLFGRGVRLKGKSWTLKRSAALRNGTTSPPGLESLETLHIFGWNADYLSAFQQIIGQEELGQERTIQLKLFDQTLALPVPTRQPGYSAVSETWTLEPLADLPVSLDLTPQLAALAGASASAVEIAQPVEVDFTDPTVVGLLDLDGLYREVVEYKAARGHGNVYVPRQSLLDVLGVTSVRLRQEDADKPDLVQEAATVALTSYLEKFVRRKEREAESQHLEPGELVMRERTTEYTYRVRVSSDALLMEIERLLNSPSELYRDGDAPLPRLHVEQHLFSPLLLDPAKSGVKEVSVSPPGLTPEERNFIRDLRDFWRAHHQDEAFRQTELYVLRNLPRAGVGFYRKSGFYPDFILWLKDTESGSIKLSFIDPHGMHHGGLSGNADKIEALKALEQLSEEPAFQARKLRMSGFLLTATPREKIPGAESYDWETLAREYKVLRQAGAYVEELLR